MDTNPPIKVGDKLWFRCEGCGWTDGEATDPIDEDWITVAHGGYEFPVRQRDRGHNWLPSSEPMPER